MTTNTDELLEAIADLINYHVRESWNESIDSATSKEHSKYVRELKLVQKAIREHKQALQDERAKVVQECVEAANNYGNTISIDDGLMRIAVDNAIEAIKKVAG